MLGRLDNAVTENMVVGDTHGFKIREEDHFTFAPESYAPAVFLSPAENNRRTLFSLLCSNPFDKSKNSNPIVLRGKMVDHASFVVTGFGRNNAGAFLCVGFGVLTEEDDILLTLCFRHLHPGDYRHNQRLSLQRFLSSICPRYQSNPDLLMSEAPWFHTTLLSWSPTSASKSTNEVALSKAIHPSSPSAGFCLQLRLVCNLKTDHDGILIKADEFRRRLDNSNDCINCCKPWNDFGTNDFLFDGRNDIEYSNETIRGLDELKTALAKGSFSLCGKDCLCSFMSKTAKGAGIRAETNLPFATQCWGCGGTSNVGVKHKLAIWYEHKYRHYANVIGVLFREEDGLMASPDEKKYAEFCSKDCFFRALPTVLDLCKEWQWHDLTVDMRTLAMRLPAFMNDDRRGPNAGIINALVSNGWAQDEERNWFLGHPDEGKDFSGRYLETVDW